MSRDKLRTDALEAQRAFMAGEIDGFAREKIVSEYMQSIGMTSLNPSDGAKFEAALEAAETEDDVRQAMILRDTLNARDAELMGRLEPGTRRIYSQGIEKVNEGKRTVDAFDRGIQRYRDATERTIRNADTAKSFGMEQAAPGIEWQGGQLRSGSVRGEIMPAAIAAISFVDKYHRSSMPGNGIVPNVSVSGVGSDGEIITIKVPENLIKAIYDQSAGGNQPDPSDLIKWLDEAASEIGNYDGEWDIFADDSDNPVS